MLRTRYHSPRGSVVLVTAAVALLAGCSTGGGSRTDSPAQTPSAAQPDAATAGQPVGVSPGGMTPRPALPAQSTEEQYAQACLAAKEWMTAKGGDPHTMVEPYLKEVQASVSSGPATFRKTWATLSQPDQAAVIIAVQAAADGGC
ncbi:MAG: hypothetical protein NT146_09295 [Mycobacterium sp.]|nr:hypothetical protein [Mycobacterium sp.]